MKRETCKERINEVVQAHQLTIVLKLRAEKDNNITCERGILTRLIKQLITPQREEDEIKPKGIKIGYSKIHQIHQVQWILFQV